MEEFVRAALLLGEEGIARLREKSVIVFGVGGVGSFAAEALARCGVGRLTFVDDDAVAVSNINRQLVALHSTVGRKKAEVMRERALDINPNAEVTARCVFYGAQTAEAFDLAQYDYVVDAMDTVSSKLLLIERARDAKTPVISAMGAGNKLDPAGFAVTDIKNTSGCPLARVMRKELKKRGIESLKVVYSREEAKKPREGIHADTGVHKKRQTPGSVSFVPPAAGLILAGEVVRDLLREAPKIAEKPTE
ncbi:MAG: tRNA threonylcarbamoyladenosine dehydratase [Clostridiaceae bacterium]|nr:tRNA threonylcarbamoyladenosine dehydratase [Eubacteriales bacterium]